MFSFKILLPSRNSEYVCKRHLWVIPLTSRHNGAAGGKVSSCRDILKNKFKIESLYNGYTFWKHMYYKYFIQNFDMTRKHSYFKVRYSKSIFFCAVKTSVLKFCARQSAKKSLKNHLICVKHEEKNCRRG